MVNYYLFLYSWYVLKLPYQFLIPVLHADEKFSPLAWSKYSILFILSFISEPVQCRKLMQIIVDTQKKKKTILQFCGWQE